MPKSRELVANWSQSPVAPDSRDKFVSGASGIQGCSARSPRNWLPEMSVSVWNFVADPEIVSLVEARSRDIGLTIGHFGRLGHGEGRDLQVCDIAHVESNSMLRTRASEGRFSSCCAIGVSTVILLQLLGHFKEMWVVPAATDEPAINPSKDSPAFVAILTFRPCRSVSGEMYKELIDYNRSAKYEGQPLVGLFV